MVVQKDKGSITMSKGLEALLEAKRVAHISITSGTWDHEIEPNFDIAEKELLQGANCQKALKIIVKKANIRLFERNERYYFKTTNNIYEISKEKYDLLKEVLNDA